MSDRDELTGTMERIARCDHICLKEDGHDGLHFHGYENPSPRRFEFLLAPYPPELIERGVTAVWRVFDDLELRLDDDEMRAVLEDRNG